MVRITIQNLAQLPIMKEFYDLVWNLFRIRVVLRSYDGITRQVLGEPPTRSPFCTALRIQKIGERLCEECDRQHIQQAITKGKSLRYQCHAGLTEFIIPIMLHKQTIAFLVSGQILDRNRTEQNWSHTQRALKSAGVDTSLLEGLYFAIPCIPYNTQKDLMALLELFANYVASSHDQTLLLEETRTKQIVTRARSYINNHFAQAIYLSDVARAAYTSDRNLRRIFRTETGTTVWKYIHSVRVANACDLLRTTDKTCTQIAGDSGFGSLQQFNLVFRKLKNTTPTKWRASATS